MYIINFMTIRYDLTALGNIIDWMLNYMLMRPSSFYGYIKYKKQAKTANSKKIERESVEWKSIKKWNFHWIFFYFQLIG